MLLAREFVDYISRQVIVKLTPQWIETTNSQSASGFISEVIEEDLAIEDKLNDEVREMLSQYSEYMRREGVSYQDMFRKIKNTMITQRKIVRAAGRDTGDAMKLSRDKVNDLSHQIVTGLRKRREFRLKKDQNDLRLEMVKVLTDILLVEEKVADLPGRLFEGETSLAAEGGDVPLCGDERHAEPLQFRLHRQVHRRAFTQGCALKIHQRPLLLRREIAEAEPREGLARELSLPVEGDTFSNAFVSSYRDQKSVV